MQAPSGTAACPLFGLSKPSNNSATQTILQFLSSQIYKRHQKMRGLLGTCFATRNLAELLLAEKRHFKTVKDRSWSPKTGQRFEMFWVGNFRSELVLGIGFCLLLHFWSLEVGSADIACVARRSFSQEISTVLMSFAQSHFFHEEAAAMGHGTPGTGTPYRSVDKTCWPWDMGPCTSPATVSASMVRFLHVSKFRNCERLIWKNHMHIFYFVSSMIKVFLLSVSG